MSELNQAQREALLASADLHEEAAKTVRGAVDALATHGYTVYGKELIRVVRQMIGHADAARDLARKP
jgi:hypothetical protein